MNVDLFPPVHGQDTLAVSKRGDRPCKALNSSIRGQSCWGLEDLDRFHRNTTHSVDAKKAHSKRNIDANDAKAITRSYDACFGNAGIPSDSSAGA